jgi:hypothetical protein
MIARLNTPAPRVSYDLTQLLRDFGFATAWCVVHSGRPKIISQASTASQRGRFVAEMGVCVGLIEQTEAVVLPFLWIKRFSVCIIRKGFLVLAERPVNFPAHDKRDRLGRKLDDLVYIIQRPLCVSKLHPSKMPVELSVRISGILSDPLVDNTEIALRIGSQKFVEHLYLFWRRRFFH